MADRHLYSECPLCNSTRFSVLKKADCSEHPLYNLALSPVMVWNKCDDCSHVFTEGHFTDQACEIIFSKTHEHQKVGNNLENNRIISARMIEKVLPYASEGPWLDVGFGNGSLLFTAQEYGFDPIGVDLRKDNVAALKKLGFEAYCEDITKLDVGRKCSVVSLMDVLEHVPFPRDFLKSIHGLLREDGVLFLSMPNSENIVWDVATLKNANPYWGEIEHYHNFSRSRLYAFLAEFGFEAVRYGVSERYRSCMEVVAVKRH